MADATTSNVALIVPARGADPGTWDVPVNSNSTAIDGMFGGVGTISLTNANLSLTAPAGTIVPTTGPFQSQNRILKFTGALTGNVVVGLPLPGKYTIQNLTTGNFVVQFQAIGAGKVVSTPQGSIMDIWNDGTDVWLVKNQIPGAMTFLGGVFAVPAWVAACSIPPYLVADGTVYNTSAYPALGTLYGAAFGGNGTTTFGVEDLRGRVPVAWDGTGTRITVAGCGVNGTIIGAAGGVQVNNLITSQMPPYTPTGTIANGALSYPAAYYGTSVNSSAPQGGPAYIVATATPFAITQAASTFAGAPQGGTSANINNVPPFQVSGIWLIAT